MLFLKNDPRLTEQVVFQFVVTQSTLMAVKCKQIRDEALKKMRDGTDSTNKRENTPDYMLIKDILKYFPLYLDGVSHFRFINSVARD